MKRALGIALVAAITVALLAGCGDLFGPEGVIEEFSSTKVGTSGNIEVDTNELFTLTVVASTDNSMGESDLTDYSGTIEITSSPAGISETATFDRSTTKTFTVSLSTAGTYTITATLTDSTGDETTATLTAVVTASDPWSGATITDLVYAEWQRGNLSSSTSVKWYKKTAGSSTYYVHYFDDGASYLTGVANIGMVIYGDDGTILDSGETTSPSMAVSTTGYGSIYIKVFCDGTDYGDFYITIDSDSTPPTTGTVENTGGSTGSILAGEIEVWYVDITTSGYYDFQWEDSDDVSNVDTGASYTCDTRVSAWEGVNEPLFVRDDTLSPASEHNHYIPSSSDAYIIVEGYSTSSAGTYYVDVD